MGEKRYDYINEEEYGAYWIIDTKNCKKQLKDFADQDYPNDLYDTIAYEEYILKHGTTLTSEQVIDILNKKDAKIQELEKELALRKDKAYEYGCEWMYEYVSRKDEEEQKDELRQEIYGEKAEQKKLQELKKEIEKAVIYKNKSFYETIPPIPIHISRRPQDKIPIDERICKDCLYHY